MKLNSRLCTPFSAVITPNPTSLRGNARSAAASYSTYECSWLWKRTLTRLTTLCGSSADDENRPHAAVKLRDITGKIDSVLTLERPNLDYNPTNGLVGLHAGQAQARLLISLDHPLLSAGTLDLIKYLT